MNEKLVYDLLLKWVSNIIDNNWDEIIKSCAREAVALGYEASTVTDKQLAKVMAGKIRETNFLNDHEADFYLFCMSRAGVNWAKRIKDEM